MLGGVHRKPFVRLISSPAPRISAPAPGAVGIDRRGVEGEKNGGRGFPGRTTSSNPARGELEGRPTAARSHYRELATRQDELAVRGEPTGPALRSQLTLAAQTLTRAARDTGYSRMSIPEPRLFTRATRYSVFSRPVDRYQTRRFRALDPGADRKNETGIATFTAAASKFAFAGCSLAPKTWRSTKFGASDRNLMTSLRGHLLG